jgi:hypothetical protein
MSGHVVVLAALLLAGTGAAGPAPEPIGPAAQSEVAVQAAAEGDTIFSCRLPRGKIVTVTRDGEQFLYRYGTAGRTELTIEGTEANGRIFKQASVHGGTYDIQLRFVSGEYSYIVHSFPRSDIVDNVPRSGLMVFRGGKKIMDRNCAPWAEISFGDFGYLFALPDSPAGAPSAWGE